MNDLISRQDAIDAVRHAWAKGLEPTQFLEELPSAQPDEQCDNCHYKHIWMTQRMNGNGFFGHGGATG